MSSIRYCAQADRYKKHNCCEAKIQTISDNPQGYDALCINCKNVQMSDDLESLKAQLKREMDLVDTVDSQSILRGYPTGKEWRDILYIVHETIKARTNKTEQIKLEELRRQ